MVKFVYFSIWDYERKQRFLSLTRGCEGIQFSITNSSNFFILSVHRDNSVYINSAGSVVNKGQHKRLKDSHLDILELTPKEARFALLHTLFD